MGVGSGGTAATAAVTAQEHHETQVPQPGAWRLAWLAMGICTVSWMDRTLPSILLKQIHEDTGYQYTTVTLLTGLAFSVCYAVAALPIAWLADRMNRALLLSIGVALWCSLTVGFGFASAFVLLFLCRMGVGLGEAALVPCAVSMLSDKFPRTTLPRGLALFQLGTPIGLTLALAGGAGLTQWLAMSGVADQIGLAAWRITFILAGLLGLLFVPLLLLTKDVRPPRPKPTLSGPSREPMAPYIGKVWRYLVPMIVGNACFSMFLSGYPQWLNPLFQDTYHWSLAQTGIVAGGVSVLAGVIGALGAGWITPRLSRRMGRDATVHVMLVASLMIAPLAMIGPTFDNPWVCIGVVAIPLMFTFGIAALLPGAVVNAAPSWLRARFIGMNVFVGALIGGGFGPTYYALLKDYVFGELRWSLVVGSGILFAIMIPLWLIARNGYHGAIARADETERAAGLPSHADGLNDTPTLLH